jgi:hypothetical protein
MARSYREIPEYGRLPVKRFLLFVVLPNDIHPFQFGFEHKKSPHFCDDAELN